MSDFVDIRDNLSGCNYFKISSQDTTRAIGDELYALIYK